MWDNFKQTIDNFFFRISYSKKVSFIIFFSAIVAITMTVMLERSQDKLLNSIQKQKKGIVYIDQIDSLLEKVLVHEILSHQYLKKRLSNIEKLEKSRMAVDLSFNRLVELNRNPLTSLSKKTSEDSRQFNLLMSAFRQRWEDLKNWQLEPSSEQELVKQFKDVLTQINNMITFIVNTTELVMNIDSGSHRLIDIITKNLLATSLMVPDLILMGNIHLKKGATASQRVDLMVNRNLLESNQVAIENNFEESTRENIILNELFQGSEAQVFLSEFNTSVKYFLKLIDRKLLKYQGAKLSLNEYSNAGMAILSETFELEAHTLAILNEVLEVQAQTLLFREKTAIIGVFIGLSIILLFYFSRVIRRPLQDFNKAIEAFSKGDLSARITINSNDEVALMSIEFNNMAIFFQSMITDIKGIAEHLVTSASKVTNTAKKLEDNVMNQEYAIRRIANNAKGISQTVHNFGNTLSEVNLSVSKTSELAEKGRDSLTEMETVIKSMEEGAINIVSSLALLQENVGSINIVINRVIKVVDQANLLSINSAITANKSGEIGAGFTVVSEKIRELADQTAYFTLDIEGKVKDIGPSVVTAVKSVECFTKAIREQANMTKQINHELGILIDNTQSQISTFAVVNEAMQNQLEGSSQIDNSISLLSKVAQNTTKSIGHLFNEIEFLNEATTSLEIMISQFTSKNSLPDDNSSDENQNQDPKDDETLLKHFREISLENIKNEAGIEN